MAQGHVLFPLGLWYNASQPCHVLSDLWLRPQGRGAQAWAMGVGGSEVGMGGAGVGVEPCGAGPRLSALGQAENRTAEGFYQRCPPAQLYILKHHRGAHMPELYGG